MESIKGWLIEVGIKKFGPSAIRAAIGALVAFLIAHQGLLESFGVHYDSVAQTITISLTALNAALVLALMGSIGGIIKVVNHQVATALPPATPEKTSP